MRSIEDKGKILAWHEAFDESSSDPQLQDFVVKMPPYMHIRNSASQVVLKSWEKALCSVYGQLHC